MVAAAWGIFGCPDAMRPEVNARSALRMTATSMASCVKAPATGGNRPTAATSMASPDIPIPATMLCSAMPWARLAIVTASETRSSRSTRITTSAASDDALAPRAPIAIPTFAAAKAGASLIPSPTITVGYWRCSAATASTLSAGSRSERTASRSRAAPMVCAASARSPVTITIL